MDVKKMSMMTHLLSAKFIADAVTKPGQAPVFGSPKDYGLDYEDVTFKASDGVTLSGWLVKGGTDKVIIQTHFGIQSSRSGYTPKGLIKPWPTDIVYLRHVKPLVDAGYTVLMYDQRNHGVSGSTPNKGPHDLPKNVYLDAVAVAKYVAENPEFKGQDIGLMAVCMNSMINMIAMSKASNEMRKMNIKAMTVIQPHGIDLFFKNFGLPNWVINRANRIYKKKGVTEMAGWNPIPYAKNIFVPVLFVQNVNDPWSDMKHVKEIYNAIPTEKEAIWIDEEEKHRFHTYNWFNDHPEPLINFFKKYLKR